MWHDLARYSYLLATARVAPDACASARASGESAKATQLNPTAVRQGRADLLEHRVHDPFDVARLEMRVRGGQSLDQLRLDHAFALRARQMRQEAPASAFYPNSWILGISAEVGSISGLMP